MNKIKCMTTVYLLPHKFKRFGWVLFISSLLVLTVLIISAVPIDAGFNISVFALLETPLFEDEKYMSIIENSVLDEILIIATILGGILVGFSKTTFEDEFISKIRFESLLWAMYFNVAMLLFTTIFFYGYVYFYILSFNLFSMLLFFIIRFHIKLHQSKATEDDE